MKTLTFWLVFWCLALGSLPAASAATRLKDLVSIEGVRDNQLVGYGLVVGLNGTGDSQQTIFSAQSLANMLARMGVAVSPTAIMVRNTAAVFVIADLPPFAQPGTRIDIEVGAIGDSRNLQGGILVLTPLKGADGQTYAAAQGSVVTGGFAAGGRGNTKVLNHPTAGRVPNGAIVEKLPPSVAPQERIKLQLRQADFTTAGRIATALNRKFGDSNLQPARAENAALVLVDTPAAYKTKIVDFLGELEDLAVDADSPARIVLNERTGTIVMGKEVRIAPVAILHGGLTVEIQTVLNTSQPAPLSSGQTTVTPQVNVDTKEEKARNVVLKQGASVEELVRALTAIGSTARDIIAILQSLKAAGAIQAELEVI
ncbi:MAG TPA: flagellar basal body P-ring protein FlgI [Bryobacteraceae bacterium]|nr:flagellar basal body P-ring protein FlgI [Bryobacteraceae bacterium]